MVYTKCSTFERLNLWDDLYTIGNNLTIPWFVGGYLYVIISEEENIVGLPIYPKEFEDFVFFINSCELFDTTFFGIPLT